SEPLTFILWKLNHYSNNFIAQQLLYAIGSEGKHPAGVDRGLKKLRSYVIDLGFRPENFAIVDASGLSHSNRLSAAIVTRALRNIIQDSAIRPEFLSSLSVPLKSGTLEERHVGQEGLLVRAKTGTLSEATGLAGILENRAGTLFAFCILQNGVKSRAKAHKLDDEFVSIVAGSGV
ncbi:MAG: D-alanyl-D-alanine carboxypeptidase/D-alanyl-D-alanine-endopeptidase, partial [Candidatus Dadabacteria bacterium]